MKKLHLVSILLLLITTIIFNTSFQAGALSPDEEIQAIRKGIRYVENIDQDTYKRLETAVLSKYTDVEKDAWYMSVMIKLVGLGALDGSLENTLDPEGVVTKAMFIKMLVRSIYGVDGVDDITPTFDHWVAKDYEMAQSVGLITYGDMTEGAFTIDKLSDPITRIEMSKVIVKAYKSLEFRPIRVKDCQHLVEKIGDYHLMDKWEQERALLAYGAGIISGYTDGTFGPFDSANRAQASAFIIRLLDKNERAKVDFPVVEPIRGPVILRYDDPDRPMAIDGDTFIKSDGTSVILKTGPSGIVGEGQGCATEIGRRDRGGIIKEGDLGTDPGVMGQPYLICSKTGEGHYIREWIYIADYQGEEAFRKLGHTEEGTTYGPWLEYSHGKWCWTGPL